MSFRKPGATAQALLRDLGAARVIARTHSDFVRLSPHFYNTMEEIDRAIGAVDEILSRMGVMAVK